MLATEQFTKELLLALGLKLVAIVRVSVNPASVAAEATAATAVVATGALLGDVVLFGVGTADLLSVNAGIHCYISNTDVLTVNLSNNTVAAGAAIDLAAATWTFVILRASR